MEDHNQFGEEEICTRLKSALDIGELRDPQGNGVTFDIDEDHVNTNQEETEMSNINAFDKKAVETNICLMSDEEDNDDDDDDDDDGDAGTDRGYLTEMERLEKKMKKIEGSDITPDGDGGILKQCKTLGVGGVISAGSLVKVHYNAYTDIGEAPYDSTRLRGKECKIRLGKGEVIPGLELALLTMRRHELSRFLIRPAYAYKEIGCPPRIPPDATLIFDVEVLHFVEQEGVDDYYSMTPDERRSRLKYSDIEKVVKAENAEAKEYFEHKDFHKAFGKYKRAVNILEAYNLKNEDEENQWSRQLVKVYVNAAICCHNVKHFGRCITYCNLAMNMDKANIKAHYFKGKALHGLGKFEDARESLRKARNLDPSNTMVAKAMQALAKSIRDHDIFQRDMCRRMFSRPGDGGETEPASQKTPTEAEDVTTSSNHGKCSDGFRAVVREQLEKFKKDSSMTEMPFPSMPMSEAEIECILSTADELGMNVKSRGTGSSIRYEVYKKTVS